MKLVEDQEYIREELKNQGLVAFIANGSILPRESGVSTKPLKDGIKFLSPKTLEIEMNVPNQGKIKGMAIKKRYNSNSWWWLPWKINVIKSYRIRSV